MRTKIGLLAMFILFTISNNTFAFALKPPASISFRTSLLDTSTKVMRVTNRSATEALVMHLSVRNHKYNQHATYRFTVKPTKTYEIGSLEMGWCFEKGETYSLTADGYLLPIIGTVP